MPDTSRTWDGGYIREDARGRDVYVIRRTAGGRRYEISTRCHTSRAAHEQLALFEKDPAGYAPSAPVGSLSLSAELVARFLAWSRAPRPEGAGNQREWVRQQRGLLAWWADRLGATDLRRVDLARDLLRPLEGAKGRKHRIEVIKRLYSWLREVTHELGPTEDPTFGRLKVPQSDPEQWSKPKAISREDYLAVRAKLAKDSRWRDAIDVLAGTGWHVTELYRFAKGGSVDGNVLTTPQTKGGSVGRVEVAPEIAKIAKRLLEGGGFSESHFRRAVRDAREDAGVIAEVRPGVFRHSVATHAVNAGMPLEKVATFLNHKDKRTTRRFYATFATPAKVPTLAD